MEDLVSVVIPMYNAELFIKETITSVINQTYKNIEIIVIDDKSKDKSAKIVEEMQKLDSRIRYIEVAENKGVANARNIGIKNSKGRFIAFIDSDDLWKPNKLENQIKFMLDNNYGFTFTAYEYINENGATMNKIIHTKNCVNYKNLLQGNCIGCSTVIIDKSIISKIYMPEVRHEDYVTWLNILKLGNKAYGLEENLGYYRKFKNSLSGNKIQAAKWTWNIYINVEKLPRHKAIYYFTKYALKNIKKHFFK